ncbi:MAG: NUDIX hydrolase [Candidatus Saccharimonadaceae bacterium]
MNERFKLTSAVYLVLRKDDEVLLLQRANSPYHNGMYGLVAGHMDGGELGTSAMIREAKEEAGIELLPEDLRFVHLVHTLKRGSGDEYLDIFYEASKWNGIVTNVEPHKCSDLSWFPVDNLPENMIPVIKSVLNKIKNNEHYSEYKDEPK